MTGSLWLFFLTLADIGTYDFALKCLLIIEFILNGLHNSFYPKVVSAIIAQDTKGSAPEINRYYNGFIALIMLLICGSILILPLAIEMFVNKPDYTQSVEFIPYLSLIYVFRAVRLFFATPYGILKYTRPLSGIYLVVSVLKIFLMWITIKEYGLFGVIFASIIAAVVEIILLHSGIRSRFNFQYNHFKILVVPAVVFSCILALEPMFGDTVPNLIHLVYVVGCLLLLGWVYRQEIKLINPFNILR